MQRKLERVGPRMVDHLGRIVLPIEIRRAAGIRVRDMLDIYYDCDDGTVLLRKPEHICLFCRNSGELAKIGDQYICRDCAEKLREML